jgi:hypothetical protein
VTRLNNYLTFLPGLVLLDRLRDVVQDLRVCVVLLEGENKPLRAESKERRGNRFKISQNSRLLPSALSGFLFKQFQYWQLFHSQLMHRE